ncbi:MAG: HAMP domain-containing histidine kinase [Bdellovibrionaceae bacterium]|nr:HAMP domain-containing histidine kinase [Pseudobdellovibrionaceae bacterium]
MNIIWKSKTKPCPERLHDAIAGALVKFSFDAEIFIIDSDDLSFEDKDSFFVWSKDLNAQQYNDLRKKTNFLGVLGPDLSEKELEDILKSTQTRFIRNLKQTEVIQKAKSQNLKYETLALRLTEQIEEQTKKLKESQDELEDKVHFLKSALQVVKSFVEASTLIDFIENFKKKFEDEGVHEVFLFVKRAGYYQIYSSDVKLKYQINEDEIKRLDKKRWADIVSHPVIHFKNFELNADHRFYLGFEFKNSTADQSPVFLDKLNFLKNIFVMIAEALIDEEEIKRDSLLWSDSFKSFKEPIFIIDEFYKIMRSNFGSVNDQKHCYKVLFDRDSPCEKCPITDFHKGKKAFAEGAINLNSKYDLNSFSFELMTEIKQRLWVHHYEDKESINLLKGQFIKSEKFAYLGNLVDIVIHRISNPLTGMKMSTQTLLNDPKADDFRDDLEEIYSGLNRCFSIIRNLKEFSESKIEVNEVSVTSLVESTLILMKSVTRNIRFVLDEGMERMVFCSKGLTQQVLFNLIHNSCQAMDYKGGILLRSGEEEGVTYLEVIDTGHGIAVGLEAQIFSPFFSTKTTNMGTGIGLFLSKLIMEQSGGDLQLLPSVDVEVEGQKFTGARFRMSFSRKKF